MQTNLHARVADKVVCMRDLAVLPDIDGDKAVAAVETPLRIAARQHAARTLAELVLFELQPDIVELVRAVGG